MDAKFNMTQVIKPASAVEIELSLGKKCLIDAEDHSLISQFKWRAAQNKKAKSSNWYARGYGPVDPSTGKRKDVFMHRLLLNAPSHLIVDHINGDSLDNRRSNLRCCNHSGNSWNQKRQEGKAEIKYRGVFKTKNRFQVHIGKQYRGSFKSEHLAALYYDLCIAKERGEFARPNFPDDVVQYVSSLESVIDAARELQGTKDGLAVTFAARLTRLYDTLQALDGDARE